MLRLLLFACYTYIFLFKGMLESLFQSGQVRIVREVLEG